jgi:hypothetical protein
MLQRFMSVAGEEREEGASGHRENYCTKSRPITPQAAFASITQTITNALRQRGFDEADGAHGAASPPPHGSSRFRM